VAASDAQPASSEVVHRPAEPGLARGLWEASPFAFYVAFAVLFLLAVGYAGARLGLLRRRRPPQTPSATTRHP
jgi:hypothetical protein